MRTPREAATSRAPGATMAPGGAEISPPGGTAWTSWAVTTSFKRAMITNARPAGQAGGLRNNRLEGNETVRLEGDEKARRRAKPAAACLKTESATPPAPAADRRGCCSAGAVPAAWK